jgi:hypothetical protein
MKPHVVLVCLSLVMMTAGTLPAAGHPRRGGHCVTVCPKCRTSCQLEVVSEKEEKSCWQVECDQVCVPRVVFPWQTGKTHSQCRAGCYDSRSNSGGPCTCFNNGAWVRTIKKLKKHSYECPACKYEWTTKTVTCGGIVSGSERTALVAKVDSDSPVPAPLDSEMPDQATSLPPLPEAAPERETDVTRLRFPFQLFTPSAGQRN